MAALASVAKIALGARAGSRGAWIGQTALAPVIHDMGDMDRAFAMRAADGLAVQWDRRLAAAYADDLRGPKAYRTAAKALSPSLDRTAVTETARAWNDETIRQNDYLFARGLQVEETWCALLDACPICEDRDGERVIRPNEFEHPPPAHPRCRCFLLTYVDQPEALAA